MQNRPQLGVHAASTQGVFDLSLYYRKDSPIIWMRFKIFGRKVRCSTGTTDPRAAEEVEQRERQKIHAEYKIGERGTAAFGEVAERWLRSTRRKADASRLGWFLAQPDVAETQIGNIDALAIAALRQDLEDGVPGRVVRRRKDGSAYGRPRGHNTVDRHMTVLRAILNYAKKAKLLADVPYVPMYNDEKGLPDWLTPEEFQRLHAELPRHLQICARFAVATGMRETSMLKLTWDRIDLKRKHAWAPGETMKGGKPFGFPLNTEALAALAEARAYAPHGAHVFQYLDPMLASLSDLQMRQVARELLAKTGAVGQRDLRRELMARFGKVGRTERRQAVCREETAGLLARGKVVRIDSRALARAPEGASGAMRPITVCYTDAFRKAVERAHIAGKHVTWHTLRHTWASWLIQNGATPLALKQLGNWKTDAMMANYAHLASANFAATAALLPEMNLTKNPGLKLIGGAAEGKKTRVSGTNSATDV